MKTVKKVMIISIISILALAIIAFVIFEFTLVLPWAENLQKQGIQEHISRYELSNYMTLKKEVDFSSFEPLADNNQFYLNGIEAENDGIYLEKYYLDNCLMYSDKTKPDKINPDEIDYEELPGYYYFGTDENNLNFCLCVKDNYNGDQWYIRKNYTIPEIGKNKVKSLKIVPSGAKQPYALNHCDFTRIDTSSAVEITDENLISQCVQAYQKGQYRFEFLSEYADANEDCCFFVLAEFENDSLYQSIGYIQLKK